MKNPFQRNKRKFRALENRIDFMESALVTYVSSPIYEGSDDIGFNGQKIRKMIFNELFNMFSFEAIIETGTYTGNTSGYLANATSLPIYTCETSKLLFSIAKKRLSEFKDIHFYAMDSREFLTALSKEDVSNKKVFIYLDAHGYDDLPLKQEIETICRTWKDFVIMIDDFQVPNDSGYGHDSYAGNQVLSADVFLPVFLQNGLDTFFPSQPSINETGAKRGSVILAKNGDISKIIGKSKLLKQHLT